MPLPSKPEGFDRAPIINGGFSSSSSSCADLRQRLNGAPISMAASFCKFSGIAALFCRFKVYADIFCLGNATASHTRTFFRLQRQARGLQQMRSERATFLQCFRNQHGKRVTSDCESSTPAKSERSGTSYGGGERTKPESDVRGVCETDPP